MATVVGSVKLANRTEYGGTVLFRPISTPLVDAPDLITTEDVTATVDADGDFSITLSAGLYKVFVGKSKYFTIDVPDDDDSHNLLDLITTELESAGTHSWAPGEELPTATSTTQGVVKTSSDEADPVVLLVSDAETDYVQTNPDEANYRIKNGRELQLWDTGDSKWHTVWLVNGVLTLGVGED